MQPLYCDPRTYYRKHQVGETVNDDGTVDPEFAVDGPYRLSFTPTDKGSGERQRPLGEQGFNADGVRFFVIADAVKVFQSGDILTDGHNDLYEVLSVKTWPTEQTFYVRELTA